MSPMSRQGISSSGANEAKSIAGYVDELREQPIGESSGGARAN